MVDAVNGQCEVYLDGGVRQGTDVLKAVALGAKAVFIGRPAIYGLSYNVMNIDPHTSLLFLTYASYFITVLNVFSNCSGSEQLQCTS